MEKMLVSVVGYISFTYIIPFCLCVGNFLFVYKEGGNENTCNKISNIRGDSVYSNSIKH